MFQMVPLYMTVFPVQFAKSSILWNPIIYICMNRSVSAVTESWGKKYKSNISMLLDNIHLRLFYLSDLIMRTATNQSDRIIYRATQSSSPLITLLLKCNENNMKINIMNVSKNRY